jgi:hypothetical protein
MSAGHRQRHSDMSHSLPGGSPSNHILHLQWLHPNRVMTQPSSMLLLPPRPEACSQALAKANARWPRDLVVRRVSAVSRHRPRVPTLSFPFVFHPLPRFRPAEQSLQAMPCLPPVSQLQSPFSFQQFEGNSSSSSVLWLTAPRSPHVNVQRPMTLADPSQ